MIPHASDPVLLRLSGLRRQARQVLWFGGLARVALLLIGLVVLLIILLRRKGKGTAPAAAVQQTQPTALPEKTGLAEGPKANFCPKCGAAVDKDAAFCKNCGNKIG